MRLFFYLIIISANVKSLIGKSLQDTGYFKPSPYYFINDSNEMREVAKRFLPSNPVVIEAGAFDGTDSKMMAQLWPEGTVYAFEPIKSLYVNVVQNTQSFKNIRTFNQALGNVNENRSMFLALNPNSKNVCMSSSLFPPKDHHLYYDPIFEGSENVRVTRLDDWARENNIDKVDMLWLDLQGAELSALKGGENLLANISVIVTEVEFSELYEGQPLYREVKGWLEDHGFVLIGGTFKFPKDRNQHFGDALFIRKTLLNHI